MSAALMEPLGSARSASVGRRTSIGGSSQPAGAAPVQDEIIEDRRRFPDGSVQVRKYLKGRFLGKGGFAKCYAFTSMSKNKVLAGKVVLKSSLVKERAKQKLLAEIKIHRDMNHPSIVKFESFFEDKVAVYILLELCTNNTMMELVRQRKRLTEPEAAYYMLQLIDGMRYMHAHNVIHRDLKLGNLFLNRDMQIKLGDFGLAAKLDAATDRRRTICGTPNYIAPEILNKKSSGHSFEVDIWSLGVILYTMVVGKPPYETADIESTYKRIRANTYSFPEGVPLSESVKNLVRSILQLEPEARPSLDTIAQHPFFTGAGVMIPVNMPGSSLTLPPVFQRDDLVPGATLIAQLLSRPIGELKSQKAGASENVGITTDVPASKEMLPHTVSSSAAPRAVVATAVPLKESATSVPSISATAAAVPARKPFGAAEINAARADGPVRRSHSLHPTLSSATRPMPLSVNDAVVSQADFTSRPPTTVVIPPLSMPIAGYDKQPAGGGPLSAVTHALPTADTPTATASSRTARASARPSFVESARAQPKASAESGLPESLPFPVENPLVSGGFGSGAALAVDTRRVSTGSTGGGALEKDKDALQALHDHIVRTMGTGADAGPGSAPSPVVAGPSLWVTTWVDYTSKYGLGYMLSNGSVGVYFNDSTKIVLASDGKSGEYIERSTTATDGARVDAPRMAFNLDHYPVELAKKVTLLKHFRGYLLEQYKSQPVKCDEEARALEAGSPSVNIPFVKKWVKTRHAILFRMSNRVVQINFFDHSAIVLSSDSTRITYVSKEGVRSHHKLSTIMHDNRPDIAKRLKYTKDILSQLISGAAK